MSEGKFGMGGLVVGGGGDSRHAYISTASYPPCEPRGTPFRLLGLGGAKEVGPQLGEEVGSLGSQGLAIGIK